MTCSTRPGGRGGSRPSTSRHRCRAGVEDSVRLLGQGGMVLWPDFLPPDQFNTLRDECLGFAVATPSVVRQHSGPNRDARVLRPPTTARSIHLPEGLGEQNGGDQVTSFGAPRSNISPRVKAGQVRPADRALTSTSPVTVLGFARLISRRRAGRSRLSRTPTC
jgi:hypothetical protein